MFWLTSGGPASSRRTDVSGSSERRAASTQRAELAGHDLLVQSPTGSGKTLAFGIPLVDRVEPDEGRLSALVLAPTRELASQIVDELDSIARSRKLRIAAVYGGVGFGPQTKA